MLRKLEVAGYKTSSASAVVVPEEYTIIHSEKADDVRRWATVTARTRDKRDKEPAYDPATVLGRRRGGCEGERGVLIRVAQRGLWQDRGRGILATGIWTLVFRER